MYERVSMVLLFDHFSYVTWRMRSLYLINVYIKLLYLFKIHEVGNSINVSSYVIFCTKFAHIFYLMVTE